MFALLLATCVAVAWFHLRPVSYPAGGPRDPHEIAADQKRKEYALAHGLRWPPLVAGGKDRRGPGAYGKSY